MRFERAKTSCLHLSESRIDGEPTTASDVAAKDHERQLPTASYNAFPGSLGDSSCDCKRPGPVPPRKSGEPSSGTVRSRSRSGGPAIEEIYFKGANALGEVIARNSKAEERGGTSGANVKVAIKQVGLVDREVL